MDSDAIVGQFSSAIQETPFGTLHSFVDWFLSLAFNIVRFVAENVTINLQFDEGVTCSGITSLLVLPILCLLTAIMVLIFDSSLFTFLEIASSNTTTMSAISCTDLSHLLDTRGPFCHEKSNMQLCFPDHFYDREAIFRFVEHPLRPFAIHSYACAFETLRSGISRVCVSPFFSRSARAS